MRAVIVDKNYGSVSIANQERVKEQLGTMGIEVDMEHHTFGVGVNSVDLEAATKLGKVVLYMPGCASITLSFRSSVVTSIPSILAQADLLPPVCSSTRRICAFSTSLRERPPGASPRAWYFSS